MGRFSRGRPSKDDPSAGSDRWSARTRLSALVSVAAFLLPILIAIAAAAGIVHLFPEPRSVAGLVVWWITVVTVPWVIYLGASRLARRALPLAALLKMTLVFPDQAPSRMAVARRAGSTRALERQLEEAEAKGIRSEPSVAAEQILALAASLNRHDRKTRGIPSEYGC